MCKNHSNNLIVLLLAAAFLFTGCAGRSGETLGRGDRKELGQRWGVVAVMVPSDILWEAPVKDGKPSHGSLHLYDPLEDVENLLAHGVEKALKARGLKLYPTELASGMQFKKIISPARYARLAKDLVVLETRKRPGRKSIENTHSRFLSRPLITGASGVVHKAIDKPTLYDFSPLKDKGVSYAIVIDLTEMTLTGRRDDEHTQLGYALLHLFVVSLEDGKVLSFQRVEKPAGAETNWIFGPELKAADLVELRRGKTDSLLPAFENASINLVDLALWHLGFIKRKEFARQKTKWDSPEPN